LLVVPVLAFVLEVHSMKQEIVLPKLRVPGQANWLLRGLWIGVTVVSVWVVVLGVQLWRRGSTETPAPVATLPPAAPAVPTAPGAAAKAAGPAKGAAPVKPGAPGAPAAAATPGAGKTFVGKFSGARHRGSRALRGRAGWAKGHGKVHRGGRRALLARKAYLRKKRFHAARAAGRVGGAGVTPGAKISSNDLFPTTGRAAAKAPAKAAKGDPIDDILRNFK
jgi:hypothetical protein